MAEKRAHSPEPAPSGEAGAIVAVKKARGSEIILGSITADGIKRTSNLHAPIMKLTGHSAEVFSVKFSPGDGQVLASSSHDKQILLWRTYGEACENYMMLSGHKNAVLEVAWFTDGEKLLSCSADKTVRAWDAVVGKQIKKLNEHDNFVNGVAPLRRGGPLFVTGSDDATVKVWDMRVKKAVASFAEKFQVCAVAFGDAGDTVYSGGLDNAVKAWDLRKVSPTPTLVMKGHGDTVTGLRLSPDGTHLLSNSMDNTARVWDIRPFAPANRNTKVFTGHMHNFEKNLMRCDWSPDGTRVSAGSADKMVYVWEESSAKLLYKLPGHTGSVNEVVFHPKEPIIASAGSDRTIYLGELALA